MAKAEPKERGIEATLAALALTPPQAPAPSAAPTLPLTDDTDGDDDPLAEGDDDLVDDDDDPSLQGGDAPLPAGDRPPPIAPAFVPPAAPATRGRPKAPPKQPAGGRLDKALTEMAPGADRVKIYKRLNGQRWLVGDYTKNDLKGFSDYDSFVTRFIKPKYEDGEYNIVGIDSRGKEYELGEVRLMPDPTRTPEMGAIGLVERIMNEARDQQTQMLARLGTQQSPLELLTGVLALKKQMEGEAGEPLAAAARAASESKSDMVQMMMLMMQMQQQQAAESQKMLMTLMAPKEDPLTKILLMKLLEGGLSGGGGGGGALPPPPPPEKKESMAELIAALGTFMSAMSPGAPDDGYKEQLTTLLPQLLAPRSDGLGTKEIIELLITKRPEGGNEFKSAIDNMATMMNIAQNFNRANEPGAAAGFFDMMSALFSNRDFAGSLAQTIRSKLDGSAGAREQRIQAEEQRLAMERRQLERERRTLPGGGGQPVQQAPQQGAPPPPQQQAQRPPHTPMVTTEQAQEAAKRVVERQGTLPPLPNLTYEHVNSIVMAKDEGECVAKIVSMLIYFAEHEGWKQFIEQILSAFRDGERKRALQWLKALFEGLEQIGMLPPKSPPALLGLMDKHFKTIQEQLAELSVEADAKVTAEALVEGPNVVEAPAEPTPPPAAPPAAPDAAPEAAPPAAE
jgi:hypothetical protein